MSKKTEGRQLSYCWLLALDPPAISLLVSTISTARPSPPCCGGVLMMRAMSRSRVVLPVPGLPSTSRDWALQREGHPNNQGTHGLVHILLWTSQSKLQNSRENSQNSTSQFVLHPGQVHTSASPYSMQGTGRMCIQTKPRPQLEASTVQDFDCPRLRLSKTESTATYKKAESHNEPHLSTGAPGMMLAFIEDSTSATTLAFSGT